MKTFYMKDVSALIDEASEKPVVDIRAWALEHLRLPAPLIPDPSDDYFTIGLIYRQRVGARSEREQRYVVVPKEAHFNENGSPEYLGGGSLTEEHSSGQLDWERRFDDPKRFVALYDRSTGEILSNPSEWLRQEAEARGLRIYGINA